MFSLNVFMSEITRPESARPSHSTAVLAAVWLAAVVAVMVLMLAYSSYGSPAGAAPDRWPAASRISPSAGLPALILFAHPHCPCTRATLGELENLMAALRGKPDAQVWFIQPSGVAADWTETDLRRRAAAIPGVTVHDDRDGIEARRFQAETSGQTLLYDREGKLLYQGGITIARGHSGDNPGRDAVAALLEHPSADRVLGPVFGCALFESNCRSTEDSPCSP